MPNFRNTETACTAAGLALNSNKCYYISAAGPGVATSSIWSSLFSNASKGASAPEWSGSYYMFSFGGEKSVKTIWTNLPESSYKHFVCRSPDPHVIMLIDPKAVLYSHSQRLQARQERMGEVYDRFFIWMKKQVDVPVQRPWVETIWHDIEDRMVEEAIKPILSFGDCIGAWLLNPQNPWSDYISNKVKKGVLRFH